jgi:hypothetical protein
MFRIGEKTMSTFPAISTIWTAIEPGLLVLFILTIIDTLFGVVLSVIDKTFKWEYLTHYLNTDIMPTLAWVAIAVIGFIPQELLPAQTMPIFATTVYATVVLSILGSLYEHFKTIGVMRAS